MNSDTHMKLFTDLAKGADIAMRIIKSEHGCVHKSGVLAPMKGSNIDSYHTGFKMARLYRQAIQQQGAA